MLRVIEPNENQNILLRNCFFDKEEYHTEKRGYR